MIFRISGIDGQKGTFTLLMLQKVLQSLDVSNDVYLKSGC